MPARTPRASSGESASVLSTAALPSNGFLESLLAHKKQEASLLFANWDDEGVGVVSVKHLRPILASVFPPPLTQKEAACAPDPLLLNATFLVSSYEELLDLQNVRLAYRTTTRRAMGPLGPSTQSVFTLNELHSIMDCLFFGQPKESRNAVRGAFINSSSSQAPRTAVASASAQVPTTAFGEAALVLSDEPFARASVPVLPIPVDRKTLDNDDSASSTGRDSSSGGHSSSTSHATTGLAATNVSSNLGAAVLLCAGTAARLGGTTALSIPAAPTVVPSHRLALVWGCLERAFQLAERSNVLDGFFLSGRSWSGEERASVLTCMGVSAQVLRPLRFDKFVQLVLTGGGCV